MKRTTAVIHLSAIIALTALLGVSNGIAFKNAGVIDLYLTKSSINYDSDEAKNALKLGKSLAEEICENGDVLLKNDGILPLKSESGAKLKVNLFGWGSCDNGFLYQGGGSSEGGYSGDKVSLYNAFRNNGFEINEELASAYNALSYRREGSPDQNQHSTYYRTYDPDETFFSDSRMSQAKAFSDTAIVVLSRRATEGDDLPKVNYDEYGDADATRRYLSLSKREEVMMKAVTKNFDKVIVLINSPAPMEMGFLDYGKIGAAMYIGYPGYYGTKAVAEILNGTVNPSGHLSDTAAYDLRTAPSYWNAGPDATHVYTGKGGRYTDYAEDIYVGYKWYETADAEGFYNTASLDIYGKHRVGYDAVVQFPLGYGLSYTSFDWKIDSIKDETGKDVANFATLRKDETLTFKVWVENTGEVAGKDLVQLYYGAPYTKGGIEKSAVNLGAFAKTALLEPGKGEELELTIRVGDMASYDTYDRNNNGFMGYEVEAGNYSFSLRTDAHHVKDKLNRTFKVENGYQYDKDLDTGAKVENLFTNYKNATSGAESTSKEKESLYPISIDGHDENSDYDQGITYLSRADFEGTYPKVGETRKMTNALFNNTYLVHAPTTNANDAMPLTGSTTTHWTMDDVKGLDYHDPKWDELISQLTPEELADICAGGGFGTIAVAKIGKGHCTDSDGGTGFTSGIATGDGGHATKYPAANVLASTWDWKEAYKWGHAIGEEGKALGIQGWYAPGCNVHRSPLGGRNFEYFSEDGYLCGVMVAETVKGCTENGVYAYMKHFAGNDTDEGRNGQYKWMSEQSLREIWAKPGEIATKRGKANAMMVSVDRVGGVRATGSWSLLTGLLRNEWGFKGSAITDYYQAGNVNDLDEGIRCGNDLALLPYGTHTVFDDYTSASSVIALQNAVHNILYTYIDTIYRTAQYSGVDLSSQIGSRTEDTSGRWWRPLLIGVDVGVGLGLLTWAGLSVVFTWVLKKKHA